MDILYTQRLTLRRFNLDDVFMVSKLCNNMILHEMTFSLPYPYTEAMAVEWIDRHDAWWQNNERYEWAIVHTQTNQLMGAIGLGYHPTHNHGELGYWMGEPFWNQGYASEAAQAIIKWAFEVKNYHRVFARHFLFNPASRKVMEKAGMTYEGRQIEHMYKNGRYHTLDVCSIINPHHSKEN